MDLKEVVLKAVRIIWNHKWLWVFGLFAGGASFFPNWNFDFSERRGMRGDIDPAILEWLRQNTGVIIALGVLLLIFLIFFFALSLIAQGALIGSAKTLDEEKETSFKAAFDMGLASFWRLLGFSLLLGLIVFGFILAFAAPAAIALISGNFLFIGLTLAFTVIALIFVLIPLLVIGSILANFGLRAVVLDGQGAVAAIKSAWRLFRTNAGQSFLIWVVSLILTVGFSFCLMLLLIILLIPLVLAGLITFMSRFNLAAVGASAFLGLVFLGVLLVVWSSWRAFLSVYWTLAYSRLTTLSGGDAEPQEAEGE